VSGAVHALSTQTTHRVPHSQSASLGDFPLAPAWPIEKITLWENFLYLMLEFKTDGGVVKDTFLPVLGIEPGTPAPSLNTSTKLSSESW